MTNCVAPVVFFLELHLRRGVCEARQSAAPAVELFMDPDVPLNVTEGMYRISLTKVALTETHY